MRLFFSGFFQLGYVTRDLDAACAAYRQRFGEVEFLVSEPGLIDGKPAPTRRLALTYIDDVMTEIIEPDPAQRTIYDDALPDDPSAMGLHHLGYLIEDHAAMLQHLARLGYQVPVHGSMAGVLDYSYADTRAHLGHFCEFIRLEEGGKAFFGAVPRHKSPSWLP